ncbi:hypothetical protein ABIC63_003632 [Pseudacidovorax sp. 1753]|uniref:hypothetical protein n=1 Tax=Pseudacidovorax sp. 1753 TaxID=3156419 RepID=UPI0033984C33
MRFALSLAVLVSAAVVAFLMRPDDEPIPVDTRPMSAPQAASLPDGTVAAEATASSSRIELLPELSPAAQRAAAMHPASRGPAVLIDASPKLRRAAAADEEPPPS